MTAFTVLYSLAALPLVLMTLHLLLQSLLVRSHQRPARVGGPAASRREAGNQQTATLQGEAGSAVTGNGYGQDMECRYVVLIPAHNEADGIDSVLRAVNRELGAAGEMIVIADNCSDETAAIALHHGASVIIRTDEANRGKHHAIRFAIGQLATSPPDLVVILDADCTIGPGFFGHLVGMAAHLKRPVQARYSLEQPADHHSLAAISVFAWEVKNHVRNQAMGLVGAPCLLTGSGMAIPWLQLVECLPASQSLAEDINLALALVRHGHEPAYCPEAVVTSRLPDQQRAQKQQRTRWEHGHLALMLRQIPALLLELVSRRRWRAALFAADLLVPPLALLVVLLAVYALGAVGLLLAGHWLPMLLALLPVAMLASAILIFRKVVGFPVLDARLLLTIARYIQFKGGIYLAFLLRPEKRWIRTER